MDDIGNIKIGLLQFESPQLVCTVLNVLDERGGADGNCIPSWVCISGFYRLLYFGAFPGADL